MEGRLLGDIVISLDTAFRQAKALGVRREERILFLMIHGFLHLLGYDHQTEREGRVMRKKEKKLWEVIKDE